MEIKTVGGLKTVMESPFGKFGYFAWPSITRLKNGKIAVSASGFRLEHVCPFGKAVISFSGDECETFSLPAPVIDTPLDDRDSGLCAFGTGSLLVTSFNNEIAFQRGCNRENTLVQAYLDGVTEEEEKRFLGSLFRISRDNGVTFGDLFTCPVTSPHGPVELSDGSLLWVGRTFRPYTAHDGETEAVEAHRVFENGTTEYLGSIENVTEDGVSPLLCEPYAIELDNGDVLCHIRAEKYGKNRMFTTYQSVSHDRGRTWSRPERILEKTGGAPAHIIKHPSGALISVYGYREKPYGIKAAISTDNGASWTAGADIHVNGIDSDLGYPASVILKDGSIFTVFYAHLAKDAPARIYGQRWELLL